MNLKKKIEIHFLLDLDREEEISTKQLPNDFEEVSKYKLKRLSKYHLRIAQSHFIIFLTYK